MGGRFKKGTDSEVAIQEDLNTHLGVTRVLEYAFGAATVAVGWSGNVVSLLASFGINFPIALAGAPGTKFVKLSDAAVQQLTNMRIG